MQVEVSLDESPGIDAVGGGIHLMVEWRDCQGPRILLESAFHVREACIDAATSARLTVVGDRFFSPPDDGVTGTILLAESHLAIRTWPSHSTVAFDVFVCNRTRDNRAKAHAVLELMRRIYRPGREELLQVSRGGFIAGM